MRKFQELITNKHNKPSEKLSFRSLSNTIAIDLHRKETKQKPNYPSFRELANEAKSNHTIGVIPNSVE